MISKTLKTGLFIFAAATFSIAGAQEKVEIKKDKSEKMFKYLDANADEKITLEEFKAKLLKDESKAEQIEKRFLKFDKDKNGTLDKSEFSVSFDNKRKAKQMTKKEVKKG